jgi:hypothetical protein
VATLIGGLAGHTDPDFFEVLDVARRIAGNGSLGVDRYVILVRGKGSPDGNDLLDLKEALPSAVLPRVATPSPCGALRPSGWWPSSVACRPCPWPFCSRALAQAFVHAARPAAQRGPGQPRRGRFGVGAVKGC